MTSPGANQNTPSVALFDLDGTLTSRDTLLPFLTGYLIRHPRRMLALWRLAPAIAAYALLNRDRGEFKSRLIRLVMGGEPRLRVEAWASTFVRSFGPRRRFRPAALAALEAHRAAGDHLVLLSASPDLYVPRLGESLGFERTLCTEVKWQGDRLDGALTTENRRGEEKLRCLNWLRTQYRDLPIVAYGNCVSDLLHLRAADRAMLVNGNAAARRFAADAGICIADWSRI